MRLDLAGLRLEDVIASHALTLALTGEVKVRIECAFELAMMTSKPPRLFDPEDPERAEHVIEILSGEIVDSATADELSGDLAVQFLGGATLRIAADPDFEAWEVTWPDGRGVIASPGGGLGAWGPVPED